MNPVLLATLRRQWPLFGAIGIFLVFFLTNEIGFRPTVRRYQQAVKRAADLGLSMEPGSGAAILPPRVFALLADNALPPAQAQEMAGSGALTSQLLEDLSNALSRNRIQVMLTEPGPVTQQPQSVEVRAHLRVRCSYPQFVALLDDLSRGPGLISVDRFKMNSQGGADVIEMWVSRFLLKKSAVRK